MDAACENLSELPCVVTDGVFGRAVDRGFDDDGWGAVTAVRGATGDQAFHVVLQTAEVERTVLHAHVDVVGPSAGIFHPLFVRENRTRVAAGVVDRLVL